MTNENLLLDADSPLGNSLEELRDSADACRRCELWEHATQTVFGEGASKAKILMVGEQPGDQEDLQGHPFVGPAGRLLDECMEEAGLDRQEIYITNAVKHFKWIAQGQRRLHQKPNRTEITACHVWLEAEIEAVQPEIIVCLGATAVQSFLGTSFKLTQHRGEFQTLDSGIPLIATLHPSAVLRALDAQSREEMRSSLVKDLCLAKERLASL